MVFSHLFFVFIFLALNLLVYCLMPGIRLKNACMLIFSLIFYAFAGPKYVILLVSMVLVSYLFALAEEHFLKKGQKKGAIAMLVLDVVSMLGTLAYFKYAVFFFENIKYFSGLDFDIPEIILPIGISFYTFQLISYNADVAKGEVSAQKNYFRLLLYAAMFHQCIAGPIIRYSTVEKEINERKFSVSDCRRGILRFCTGLAKKAFLANTCASVVDNLIPAGADQIAVTSAPALWVGMFFFMLQIYLDFSAYSDMAIGMGLMIGFHYDENFNYPYVAVSATDFWRRWHISLSTFFRDYVYIPLGGNRCSAIRNIFNLLVVWALTGFWHGASWNFIIWGLYYFILLVIEKYIIYRKPKEKKANEEPKKAAVKEPEKADEDESDSEPQISIMNLDMVPDDQDLSVDTVKLSDIIKELNALSIEENKTSGNEKAPQKDDITVQKAAAEKTETDKPKKSRKRHLYYMLYIPRCLFTMCLVLIGWTIFYFDDTQTLKAALTRMFALDGGAAYYADRAALLALKNNMFFLVIAIISCLPVYNKLHKKLYSLTIEDHPVLFRTKYLLDALTVIVCLLLSVMCLIGNSYNPFIYFRF